ncbi:PqqD family protein [Salipiger abyssi]|uniref:PqqD family protein n=1 Tax=Salipiger abyssi TaxID=1250539 RepID=UPI001F3B2F9F|nr:PqqD family protein [Salipiger abyssi]
MIYRPKPDCMACAYGDGLAILDMKTNTYFSLDPVGATIWNALSNGADIDTLVAAVVTEFDVSPEICTADVETFVSTLMDESLLQGAA